MIIKAVIMQQPTICAYTPISNRQVFQDKDFDIQWHANSTMLKLRHRSPKEGSDFFLIPLTAVQLVWVDEAKDDLVLGATDEVPVVATEEVVKRPTKRTGRAKRK